MGSGALQIPQVLAYVITVYHDVDYNQFYKLIASMDIVVPAFADFGCKFAPSAHIFTGAILIVVGG